MVQAGEELYRLKVMPRVHMSKQLNSFIATVIDSTAGKGEMMFQLFKLKFAVNGGRNEMGYCFIKGDLYAKTGRQYKSLNWIDTILVVKQPDVSEALFLNSSAVLNSFLISTLTVAPTDTVSYTLNDILEIEKNYAIETKSPPPSKYVDGLYLSYNSFIKQTPDKKVVVKLENDFIPVVMTEEENNKKRRVDVKNVYALVYQGVVFRPTDLGYYPLLTN